MTSDSLRILVVDHESESLLRLFDALTFAGYFVEGSSRAQDALAYVRRRKPEVVLANLHMPDLDGEELAARIRAVSPGTRVVLFGASVDGRTREAALRAGAAAILDVPVRSGELKRILLSAGVAAAQGAAVGAR